MLKRYFLLLLLCCFSAITLHAAELQGYSTAVLISSDGYLLTSSKALEKSAGCSVTIADVEYPATVVKQSPLGYTLLKIDAHGLPAAALYNIEKLVNRGNLSVKVVRYGSAPFFGDKLNLQRSYLGISRNNVEPKTLQFSSRLNGESEGSLVFSDQREFVGIILNSLTLERYRAMAAISVAEMMTDIKAAGVELVEAPTNTLDDTAYHLAITPSILRLAIFALPAATQRINQRDGALAVLVPAGTFTMGSDNQDSAPNERPVRTINLSDFWISKYEVTAAQYRKFCQETARNMPDLPIWSTDLSPMVNVTWDDAEAYSRWAGGMLPTEAQWEKAARGTDGRPFPWGTPSWQDWMITPRMGSGRDNGPAQVGSYPNGASPYGIMDMSSSAAEWCADWYQPAAYEQMAADNPLGPKTGTTRVIRGGSWFGWLQYEFRTTARASQNPNLANNLTGFRCVYLLQ